MWNSELCVDVLFFYGGVLVNVCKYCIGYIEVKVRVPLGQVMKSLCAVERRYQP